MARGWGIGLVRRIDCARLSLHGGSLLAGFRPRLVTTRLSRAVRSRRSQISTATGTSPRTDKGEAHTYEFSIRGAKVRGIYCKGDTLKFNILHEDWGPGSLPFHNQATVHVAMNEMRLTTQQDNLPAPAQPPGPNSGSSLLGPIAIESTKGNDSR